MYEKIENKQIAQFQKKILDWYALHQRDLPWRKTRDPYHILISEVMSQQTQISRVIPKFALWITALPTITHLAEAPVAEVLKLWSGLGYNRRALNLKKAAETIVKEYGGNFPQDEKQLLALPGIGEYTARAVLCFAFNKQIAVVDTNVRKVILVEVLKETEERIAIKDIAQQLLPDGKAYEWNQALMDYAGAMLKKEKISIPKQSKFIGSHRYYRGQILKLLLEKKQIQLHELAALLKKDINATKSLVLELQKEGFVTSNNNIVVLNA